MIQRRIYHILIDRFFPDVSKEKTEGNFKGGNLRSIIDHLDYIQGPGMNGIMLTPFYETAAYHGYHIVDYDKVDPHFGTEDDLAELIDKVHKRGMTIVADFVANHCHKKCSLFTDGKHEDWFQRNADGTYKYFNGITDLPVFNTDNEELQEYLTQKVLRLCKLGFDAIRLDHATGPSYNFWQYLMRKVKAQYPDVSLIGEVWGKLDFMPQNRLRFLLNKFRYTAQEAEQLEYVDVLDGVLDFRYQQMLCHAANKGEHIIGNAKLVKAIRRHFSRYPSDFQLWLFLDNHDMNRFLFECNGNKELLHEGIEFSKHWKNNPYVMFYGTEQDFTNDKSIFDGTPYADERVRMCVNKEK